MKYYVKDRGLEEQYYIDSAGISGYHSGDPADRRDAKSRNKKRI